MNAEPKVLHGASASADQALVASQSSPQAVSTEGFDPSRTKHRYALCESGWIELSDGWKFLFGGSREMAGLFNRWGILDKDGFTLLGQRLRDTFGRGKAAMLDTIPETPNGN